MKTRIISFVLVLSMLAALICMPAQAETFRFADDSTTGTWDWASDYIYEAYNRQIFSGDQNGNFNADKNLTRAEAVVVVLALEGVTVSSSIKTSGFSDADGRWYTPYVAEARLRGISNGDGNGKFRPNDSVTRAEFVTMLLAAMGVDPDESVTDSGFPDANSGWYVGYVAKAKALGLTSGDENGNFCPTAPIIRAEAAVMADKVTIEKQDNDDNSDLGDAGDPVADPERYTYVTLVNAGYTKAAACGIMGNIKAECGWDVDDQSGSYYGIWQIGDEALSDLYSYCSENGLDVSTLAAQLDWFLNGGYEVQTAYFDKNKSETELAAGTANTLYPTCSGILKSAALQKEIADAQLQKTDPTAKSNGGDQAYMCAQIFQVAFGRGVCYYESQASFCDPYEFIDYFAPYPASYYVTYNWGRLTTQYGYQAMEKRSEYARTYYYEFAVN